MRFILPLRLFASSLLVFLILRSARSRQEKHDPRPHQTEPILVNSSKLQRLEIQFLNEDHVYDVPTPSDPALCENVTLFIGVSTRPESFAKRNSMRRSWIAELPDNVILRFFVGQTEFETYMELKEEERRFGDIVLYGLPDAYDKLHLKTHAMMQWQQTFCPQAAFWLKTDDDTTVHVSRLLHHIEGRFKPAMNGTKAIFCAVNPSNPVHRNRSHKAYVPRELFAGDVYPPFCSGFSYVVSSDAVAAILSGTRFVKSFHTEDALYTGVVADKMGVMRSSHVDVFHSSKLLRNVTKCDGTGVPFSSAVYIHDEDPARLQADTLLLMKNQRCA